MIISNKSTVVNLLLVSIPLAVLVFEAVLLTNLFMETYHPLPWHDEWATLLFLQALEKDPWNISLWFMQHNEHRLVLPRVVYTIDFWLFDGLNVFTHFVSVSSFAGIVFLIARQVEVIDLRSHIKYALMLSLAAFLLTGQQLSNFLWAFQVQWYLTYILMLSSISAIISASISPNENKKLVFIVLSFIFAFSASFSSASGIFTWVSIFVSAFVLRKQLPRTLPLIILLSLLVCAWLYFTGFVLSSVARSGLDRGDFVVDLLAFAVYYWGVPFASLGKHVPFVAGIFYVILNIFAFVQLLRKGFIGSRVDSFAIGVLVFVFCGGMVTAFGRFSLGIEGATESRFASITSIGWAAIFVYYFARFSLVNKSGCATKENRGVLYKNNYFNKIRPHFFIVIAISLTGLLGYLSPPYDYRPLLKIKSAATRDILNHQLEEKSLESVGFSYDIETRNAIIGFMELSKRSIYSPRFTQSHVAPSGRSLYRTYYLHQHAPVTDMINVRGFSAPESFGRWTEQKLVLFEFSETLPEKFKLNIVLGGFGPNIGGKAYLISGSVTHQFVVENDISHMRQYDFTFENVKDTNLIALIVPVPISPHSLNKESTDLRMLGVGLYSISIKE